MSDTTRRAVLAGAAGITAVTVLAACGDDKAAETPGAGGGGATTGAADPAGGTTGDAAGGLVKKSDIEVGGGKILTAGGGVVVTQPTAGIFKAFSSACTHQGCPVTSVANSLITCACHGSQFSATDGSVKKGPATKALAAKQIKIDGDAINLAS